MFVEKESGKTKLVPHETLPDYDSIEKGQTVKKNPILARQASSRDVDHDSPFGKAHTSHFFAPRPEQYTSHTPISAISLKMGFLRKVYGILCCQLALTVGICAFCMYITSVREYCVQHRTAIIWGTLIPTLISLGLLMWKKKQVPLNYWLLLLFTILESWTIGVVCAVYEASGKGLIVIQAWVITLGIFVGLTLYTCQSKRDFSGMGSYLFAGLLCLIMWGFVGLFWKFPPGWQMVYSLIGALLFCAFIVYDTHQICNKYGYDDYMMAVMELYLDIINLFIYILSLLGSSD